MYAYIVLNLISTSDQLTNLSLIIDDRLLFFFCLGSSSDGEWQFDSDPLTFHEELCRQSFRCNPVFGISKGVQAQRALFHGGTLKNGKVALEWKESHGVMLRELIAKTRFKPGEDVTCYGGFVELAPPVSDEHTHMRHIPLTDYVLEGLPFANCFPTKRGKVVSLGYDVPLHPRCDDPSWAKVIVSNGIGYMCNTSEADSGQRSHV